MLLGMGGLQLLDWHRAEHIHDKRTIRRPMRRSLKFLKVYIAERTHWQ